MEFQSHKAIFLQIADLLTDGILEKKWKVGERIPSVREIAASVQVNPNTAMRAYTYLQDHGIIANKRGIGFFVTDETIPKILEIRKEEFVTQEIPRLAKTIGSLNISFEELEKLLKDQSKDN